MEGIFAEARKIQASILPRRVPDYGSFDIAGRSEPMEEVGGDFFDYIPVTDKILGLAIADVSGHGLPAALQVRDIYMGLRMGLARDFKIVRTVERMNKHHPPEHADQPLRVDVLRRARAQRRLHLRQRRPPAAVPPRAPTATVRQLLEEGGAGARARSPTPPTSAAS